MGTTKRIGRFRISNELIEKNPDAIQKAFAQVIPVRAEQMLHIDAIEYCAISKHFEEIQEEQEAPYYDVTYNSDSEEIVFKIVPETIPYRGIRQRLKDERCYKP